MRKAFKPYRTPKKLFEFEKIPISQMINVYREKQKAIIPLHYYYEHLCEVFGTEHPQTKRVYRLMNKTDDFYKDITNEIAKKYTVQELEENHLFEYINQNTFTRLSTYHKNKKN